MSKKTVTKKASKKVTRRPAVKAPAIKPATKETEAPEAKPTVSEVARTMIMDGKTNEQVLDALIELFPGFDVATKKHYPGWYRAQLVRDGKMSKKQADATRH